MLILNIVNIEQVDHTKFLCVIINDRLNWNDHIKTVFTKVNKNTGILYRTGKNLNINTLLLLYQTLIQPYIKYCNIIWSVDDLDFLQILFIKQKKAFRAITFGKWNCHTAQICAKLHILNFCNINKCQSCSFVYIYIYPWTTCYRHNFLIFSLLIKISMTIILYITRKPSVEAGIRRNAICYSSYSSNTMN